MSKPEISLQTISSALADFLTEQFPNSTVYDSPMQQDAELPAWYIKFMPNSSVTEQIDERYMRKIHIDLAYLEDYNLPNLYDLYMYAAELLDEKMVYLPYSNNGVSCVLHVYNRHWSIDQSAMHYKITLNIRTAIDNSATPKMLELEQANESVTEKE